MNSITDTAVRCQVCHVLVETDHKPTFSERIDAACKYLVIFIAGYFCGVIVPVMWRYFAGVAR